jgi:DnaJ-class molecular chaperone
MIKVKCPECKGSGEKVIYTPCGYLHVATDRIKCPLCKGEGNLDAEQIK